MSIDVSIVWTAQKSQNVTTAPGGVQLLSKRISLQLPRERVLWETVVRAEQTAVYSTRMLLTFQSILLAATACKWFRCSTFICFCRALKLMPMLQVHARWSSWQLLLEVKLQVLHVDWCFNSNTSICTQDLWYSKLACWARCPEFKFHWFQFVRCSFFTFYAYSYHSCLCSRIWI